MTASDRDDQRDGRSSSASLVLDPVAFLSILAGLLLVFAVMGLLRSTPRALTTVAVGTLFALALDPVVGSIRRAWGWKRSWAVLLVVGGTSALVTAVVGVMGPQAVAQARAISKDLPQTVAKFYELPIVGGWLRNNDAANRVDHTIKNLPGSISDESVTRTVESLIGGALSAVIVMAVMIAVLVDGERLIAAVRRMLPVRWHQRADEVGRIFYKATAQYFGGSLAVAGLMGVVVLALCLIFGVPLAPLAALWAMLTDLVPQIGGLLGGALLGLLALTRGPVVFVAVVALFVLYMNIENHVISPAVVGRAVDVTPPTTMLAALVGGAAAGVPGALIATPLVGAIKQVYLQLRWGQQPFEDKRSGLGARLARGRLAKLFRRSS